MKILTFAGSLRKDSLNKKVCHHVVNYVQQNKLADIEFVDLKPLEIPMYDGDLESSQGIPESVQKLCAKIREVDALIISSPENNGAIAAVLKNTLDWISREKVVSIAGKHILLCAASPGALGGIRGLWHTRVPFEALGCHVYPDMMGLSKAHEAFDSEGQIQDEKTRARFEKLIQNFVQFAK